MGPLVGDHTAGIHFRSSPCRRGDGDYRQRPVGMLRPLSGPCIDVVPQASFIDSHQGDGFGRIHDGSAAQRHHHIRFHVPSRLGPSFHRSQGGVGLDTVKDLRYSPSGSQFFFRPFQVAIGPGGLAGRNHDQCPFPRQFLGMELPQLTRPEQHLRRNIDLK